MSKNMRKIKVLQVNKLYYPVTGGIEKVVQQISKGLNNKYDMKVLVCQEKGKSAIDIIDGVKIFRAGSLGKLFSMPISISFFFQFFKLSKHQDIIQFHYPFPLGDIACLLSGYKGKVVVWWHSDVVRQKKIMKLYRPIMERFLRRADVIIVATEGHIIGSDYLPRYREKCVIIPYGVDESVIENGNKYVRKKLEISQSKINFLFVGRLVYYKGCKVLLEAFSQVENANLTIIGSGELENELKAMSIELGITNKVKFLGQVDEKKLKQAFEECDIFVLPSIEKSEAFGLVQIEAMAYGKPVINTNLSSGVPYVSIDGLTGITVPPHNVEALRDAMKWMIIHKDERIQMGKKARERVKQYFLMENMLNKVMEVYN